MPAIHKDISRHDQVVPRQLHPNIASNAQEYDRAGVPEQFFHRMTFLAKPCFRLQEDRNGWAQAHLAVEGHFGGGEAQHSSDFLIGDLPPKVVLGCELSAYLADALNSLRDVLWQTHHARLLRDTPAHCLLRAQQPCPSAQLNTMPNPNQAHLPSCQQPFSQLPLPSAQFDSVPDPSSTPFVTSTVTITASNGTTKVCTLRRAGSINTMQDLLLQVGEHCSDVF